MQFLKTIQAMQNLGADVITEARSNLKKEKKETRSNTLYKDMNYVVTSNKNGVELEWRFGGASDYWNFINEGVRGSDPASISKRPKFFKNPQSSPFGFKKKNLAKGVVLKWIKNKPVRLRNKKGQFKAKTQANLKNAAFLIGRAIAKRGLSRTLFFDNALKQQFNKFENKITQALADDLEAQIETLIK